MSEDRPKIHITDKRGGQGGAADAPPTPREPERIEGNADIEELRKLADDRLDQLMRMKADFENFRKRELREKTELIERASLRIVEQLLPVLDNLDRALEAARAEGGHEGIVRGVELVGKQLHDVLVSEGLERVEAEGPFDPVHHEAVSTIPGEVDEPTVLEVVRPGYQMKGKTIRPALVHVSVPANSSGGKGDEQT